MKKLILCAVILLTAAPAYADYFGDFLLGDTVNMLYNTYKATDGSDLQRTAAGTAACHQDGSTSDITAGVSDSGTTGFNSVTGSNKITVVATAGNGFAAGHDYVCGWRAATLNAVTVSFIAAVSFSIENRSNTRQRIPARGSMVTGSTTTTIQLPNATLSASGIYQGMGFHDVTTNEDATICNSTKNGGGGNDTLSVSGLVTVPGSTDAYQIIRTGIPATCIPAVAGSGLPFINASTGAVTVEKMGQSSFTAISDKAAGNFNTFFNNNGNVASTPFLQPMYDATQTAANGTLTVESNGNISLRCAIQLILAAQAGNWSQSGSTVTFKDSSNTTTRIVGTLTSTSRGPMTLNCT